MVIRESSPVSFPRRAKKIHRKALLREHLTALPLDDLNATGLFRRAIRDGWAELLVGLTVGELGALVTTPVVEPLEQRAPRAAVPTAGARKQRARRAPHPEPTVAEPVAPPAPVDPVVQQREAVLSFVRQHPWCMASSLAEALALDWSALLERLAALENEGWLKHVGAAADTRYALG